MCGEEESDCNPMPDMRTGYRIQLLEDAPYERCCDNCANILIPVYNRSIKKCIIAPITEDPVINNRAVCRKHATPEEHCASFKEMIPELDKIFGKGSGSVLHSFFNHEVGVARVEALLDAMEKHGNVEGTEMQLGDATAFLTLALELMSKEQRDTFFNHDTVREFVEMERR